MAEGGYPWGVCPRFVESGSQAPWASCAGGEKNQKQPSRFVYALQPESLMLAGCVRVCGCRIGSRKQSLAAQRGKRIQWPERLC